MGYMESVDTVWQDIGDKRFKSYTTTTIHLYQ